MFDSGSHPRLLNNVFFHPPRTYHDGHEVILDRLLPLLPLPSIRPLPLPLLVPLLHDARRRNRRGRRRNTGGGAAPSTTAASASAVPRYVGWGGGRGGGRGPGDDGADARQVQVLRVGNGGPDLVYLV